MSGVFQNIDPSPPPPSSPPGVCVTSAFGAGEDTLAGWRGGWEDARHSSVLFISKYFVYSAVFHLTSIHTNFSKSWPSFFLFLVVSLMSQTINCTVTKTLWLPGGRPKQRNTRAERWTRCGWSRSGAAAAWAQLPRNVSVRSGAGGRNTERAVAAETVGAAVVQGRLNRSEISFLKLQFSDKLNFPETFLSKSKIWFDNLSTSWCRTRLHVRANYQISKNSLFRIASRILYSSHHVRTRIYLRPSDRT